MNYFTVILQSLLIPLCVVRASWLAWGSWSECSRTCGSGTMYKRRTCNMSDGQPCRGRDNMYRTCNTQPCETAEDFRALQCLLHDNLGGGERWLPVFDYSDRCALVCRRRSDGRTEKLSSRVVDGTNCTTPSSSFQKVCVQGRCRRIGCNGIVGSTKQLDICGVCGGTGKSCTQANQENDIVYEGILPVVGRTVVVSDIPPVTAMQERLVEPSARPSLNATEKELEQNVDDETDKMPGTGDGERETEREDNVISSPGGFDPYKFLTQDGGELGRPVGFPMYLWYETPFGDCSVTCGNGERRTSVVCRSVKTRDQVEEHLCLMPKPPHRATVCETAPCRTRWITSDWTNCSVPCGGGTKQRDVICVEILTTGAYEKTDEVKCSEDAPDARDSCNVVACPQAQWFAGQWTPCSASCGPGLQYRPVVCKVQAAGDTCREQLKPPATQQCHSGITCEGQSLSPNLVVQPILTTPSQLLENDLADLSDRPSNHQELRGQEGLDNTLEVPPIDGVMTNEDSLLQRPYQYDYDYRGGDMQALGGRDLAEGQEGVESKEEMSSGEVPAPSVTTSNVPSFHVSGWSACSVTCGHGSKTRLVQCRVLSPGYSNAVITLPDSHCEAEAPARNTECYYGECPDADTLLQIQRFAWRFVGYQACPVTCGGGLQAPLFQCTRYDPHVMIQVDTELCARVQLPEILKQSCNDFPCPASLVRTEPRWRESAWGDCSQRCGPGGYQRRDVACVREIAEGQEMAVDERVCEEDKRPSGLKLCNTVDCPPEWIAGEWTQCSSTCGLGTRRRRVACQQLKYEFTASSRTPVKVRDEYCHTSSKPPSSESCYAPACLQAVIKPDTSRYVQLQPRKVLRLVAGGHAELIEGTRIRVRTNVKEFDLEKITWSLNGRELERRGRVKVSKKGMLQIRRLLLSDSGVYVSHVGDKTVTMTIHVVTHKEARDKRMRREDLGTKSRQFLAKFRNIVKVKRNRKEEYSERFLFKHFERFDLPVMFVTSGWGPCSRSCGGAGLQRRGVTCEVNLEHYVLILNDINCLERGYDRPLDTQDCGYMACPEWRVGDWKPCSDTMCLGLGEGSMMRDLTCVDSSEDHVELAKCDAISKPQQTVPCNMTTCTSTWVTSAWTQCSVTCGGDGVQTRLLDCVWAPNRRAAFNACANIPRPSTVRQCSTQPCTPNVCVDESKHCELVKMLNLCRFKEYRTKCCWTCTAAIRLRQFRQ